MKHLRLLLTSLLLLLLFEASASAMLARLTSRLRPTTTPPFSRGINSFVPPGANGTVHSWQIGAGSERKDAQRRAKKAAAQELQRRKAALSSAHIDASVAAENAAAAGDPSLLRMKGKGASKKPANDPIDSAAKLAYEEAGHSSSN